MARVPSFPYRVVVISRLYGTEQRIENHNYSNLPGAWAYRDIALRKPATKKVEVMMVLDESTPTHREDVADQSVRTER